MIWNYHLPNNMEVPSILPMTWKGKYTERGRERKNDEEGERERGKREGGERERVKGNE